MELQIQLNRHSVINLSNFNTNITKPLKLIFKMVNISQEMNYTGMFLDCIFTVSTEHIFRTAMQQSLIKRQKMKQKKNKWRGQSEALLVDLL